MARNKSLAVASEAFDPVIDQRLPGFGFSRIPSKLQELILRRIKMARLSIEAEEDPDPERIRILGWDGENVDEELLLAVVSSGERGQQTVDCNCQFYHTWQLPCEHLLHHHFCCNSLRPLHFSQLVDALSVEGYRIYDLVRSQPVQRVEITEGVQQPERLQMNFLIQKFQENVYSLERQLRAERYSQAEVGSMVNEYIRRSMDGFLRGVETYNPREWHRLQAQAGPSEQC